MSLQEDAVDHELRQSYQTIIVDAALIISVAFALVAAHGLLPESVKTLLAFEHAEFNTWGLYTAALVHSGQTHLVNNVTAYFIASVYTYWLCFEADAQKWFRRTFIALLIALPPLVTLTSYLVMNQYFPANAPSERGFSGVAAGFGGFLLIALVVYLRRRYNPTLGWDIGITVVYLLLIEISVIYTGRFDPLIIGVSLLGVLMMIGLYLWNNKVNIHQITISVQTLKPVFIAGLVVAVLTYLVFSMFPEVVVEDGTFKNIFGHAAGFIWGGLIAGSTLTLSSPIQSANNNQ